LGAQHALVVYGRDGMDEISLGASTLVGELKDGVVREYEIHPEDFGLVMASSRALKVQTAQESKDMLLRVLKIPGQRQISWCSMPGLRCMRPTWHPIWRRVSHWHVRRLPAARRAPNSMRWWRCRRPWRGLNPIG
jgi:hypothetical protein